MEAQVGRSILETFLDRNVELPHICYHPALGPIQTCDTCMVEVNGELVRACATPIQLSLIHI